MENQNQIDPQSQERIIAVLGVILFFLPILMDKKTEYTVFYMRQGFVLLIASILTSVVTSILFVRFLGELLQFIIFVHVVFLAWKAYSGEKFEIPYLYTQSIRISRALGVDTWFTPGK
ncbi:MAG: hypothetical protein PHY14_00105 [Candidatus Gracilibacteria bacterium]|nr:hypothetical protein [Candidatus Gracilibacteria bacterium]